MENITFKTININQNQKLCYIDDQEVPLTKREYELLIFFLNKPNYIHSREDIIKELWEKKVTNRAVDTLVNRLRKKLGRYSSNLYTRLGFGYGFKTEE